MANTLSDTQFSTMLSKVVGQLKPGELDDVLLALSRRHVVRGPDYSRGVESITSLSLEPGVPKIVSVAFNASSYAASGSTATITFTFDQNITISGTPRALLADGGVALIQAAKSSAGAKTLVCQASITSADSGTLSFSGGPNNAFVTVSSYYTFAMKTTGTAAAAAGNGWTILVARKRSSGTPIISQTINKVVDSTAKTIAIYLDTDGSGVATTTITQLHTFITGDATLNALITMTNIGTGSTLAADMNVTAVTFANGYAAWSNFIDLNGGTIVAATGGATALLNFTAPAVMPTIT